MSICLQIRSHHSPVLLPPPPLPRRSATSRLRPLTAKPRRRGPQSPLQAFLALTSTALPSLAADAGAVAPDKLDVEAAVVAVDDFLNRNPFFVAGVTFVWLVLIPLAQQYLRKFKAVSAVDAFVKLRDVPGSQLLDIRGEKSLRYMDSPNLRFLGKSAVQVEWIEGREESFLKEVLGSFPDPANTVLCVLDNFDGESLKVAEFLWRNGFKEAYAVKGGLRGKDGWQEVQEKFIPPSMHVTPRKKKNKAPNDVNIVEKMNGNDIPESKAPVLAEEHDLGKESNIL